MVSLFTTIVPHLVTSRPTTDCGISGLGETPTLTTTSSTSSISVQPGISTGERRPEASGSPSSITCNSICVTRPCSLPIYLIGFRRVINSIPSSLACFTSSRRAGISSSERRYTIMARLAPNRRAVRTESIAVLPPPITATCFPINTGVSESGLAASIRLTRVRYSFEDITPTIFSPLIFINRGNPAPLATKTPLYPSSFKSSMLIVFPIIQLVMNFTPIARRFSISTSTMALGKRNSGIPYFNTPPISCNAS